MTYSDKYGNFFGRMNNDGSVSVYHVEDGQPATRLDASVYPIQSDLSARYEHEEITLSKEDAARLGLEIE